MTFIYLLIYLFIYFAEYIIFLRAINDLLLYDISYMRVNSKSDKIYACPFCLLWHTVFESREK